MRTDSDKMIVADSSYIVEGSLKEASLFGQDIIVTPDLALYEVVNSLWKHEVVLRDMKDSKEYLSLFFELVYSNVVRLITPEERIVLEAYKLALKRKCTFYDAIFVVLARELGTDLRTLDEAQRRLMR